MLTELFKYIDTSKFSTKTRTALLTNFQFTSIKSIHLELLRHLDVIITTQHIIDRYDIKTLKINALGFVSLNVEFNDLYRAIPGFAMQISNYRIVTTEGAYFLFDDVKTALIANKISNVNDLKLIIPNYNLKLNIIENKKLNRIRIVYNINYDSSNEHISFHCVKTMFDFILKRVDNVF
jgi:hypothetical protein